MAYNAPGKHFRTGLTLAQLFTMFPDDDTAEAWLIDRRWPEGVQCPRCGHDSIQDGAKHPSQRFRCRGCRKRFSVRTGTVLADSKVGFRNWVIAIYLMTTSLKGVSSMKLHRDLGVTQTTAWFMAHRIREAWAEMSSEPFFGSVKSDGQAGEGSGKNIHNLYRGQGLSGCGPAEKTAVIGIKHRANNRVFPRPGVKGGIYQHRRCKPLASLGYCHAVVTSSARWLAPGSSHTNGVKSLWLMFKRGYVGTYHRMSEAHLSRYVGEFAGRQNIRRLGTEEQMGLVVLGMVGKRLRYDDLIAA